MKTEAPTIKRRPSAVPERASPGQPTARLTAMASPGASLNLREILVPIDFSECSKKALRYAVPLAQQFGATLTLVYVIDFYLSREVEGRMDYAGLARDLRIQGSRQLVRLIGQDVGRKVMVDTLIREGRPWKEITDAAHERKTDLIVIGTHGRTGLAKTIIGSTTERVVRHAPCPVLVVREQKHDFPKGASS